MLLIWPNWLGKRD